MPSHLQGEKLSLGKYQNNVGSSGAKSAETERRGHSGSNLKHESRSEILLTEDKM